MRATSHLNCSNLLIGNESLLYGWFQDFSLSSVCSHSIVFGLDMKLSGFICLDLLNFLKLYVYDFFVTFKKCSAIVSSNICSPPHSFPVLSEILILQMLGLLLFFHKSYELSVHFINLFSFCCSNKIIFIDQSSSSLSLSSVTSIFLVSPFCEILIWVIVIFSLKN